MKLIPSSGTSFFVLGAALAWACGSSQVIVNCGNSCCSAGSACSL